MWPLVIPSKKIFWAPLGSWALIVFKNHHHLLDLWEQSLQAICRPFTIIFIGIFAMIILCLYTDSFSGGALTQEIIGLDNLGMKGTRPADAFG